MCVYIYLINSSHKRERICICDTYTALFICKHKNKKVFYFREINVAKKKLDEARYIENVIRDWFLWARNIDSSACEITEHFELIRDSNRIWTYLQVIYTPTSLRPLFDPSLSLVADFDVRSISLVRMSSDCMIRDTSFTYHTVSPRDTEI